MIFSATAGSTTSPCAAARMPSRSTGLKSRSSIAMARSPTATVSLPTCRWGPDNVAEFAACGRARWKIENETFNVLKTKGYNIEHNFGHGKHHLAAILVTLNLLAFAIHTVGDLAAELCRAARQTPGPRSQFSNNLAAIPTFLIFPSWQALLQTLAFVKPPPRPP